MRRGSKVRATCGCLAGYRQALAECGIPYEEKLVGESPSEPAEGNELALAQKIVAANLFPALTTVALPHYEMGACAGDRGGDARRG